MTYIIHPIWFYLIQVLNALQIVAIVIASVGVIALISFSITGLTDLYCAYGDEKEKIKQSLNRRAKTCIWIMGVSTIFAVLIPTKETLSYILVSQYATWENVDMVFVAIKEGVDYILTALK